MNSKFALIEIHTGFNNEKPILAWRILELYPCFDGYRTRICMDAYGTREQAEHVLAEYWEGRGVK